MTEVDSLVKSQRVVSIERKIVHGQIDKVAADSFSHLCNLGKMDLIELAGKFTRN